MRFASMGREPLAWVRVAERLLVCLLGTDADCSRMRRD